MTDNRVEPADPEAVPDWQDEYLDRVSDRLFINYDLEKDHTVEGSTFDMYGRMEIENEKHFFHPALNYANHVSIEHLFAKRMGSVAVSDLERFVDLGDRLADEWIVQEEKHFSTDFTFVAVTEEITPAVREFVSGFESRTLLKYGFNGHYETNLVVTDPDGEDIVRSQNANIWEAFRTWEPIEQEEPGLWDLITRRLQI